MIFLDQEIEETAENGEERSKGRLRQGVFASGGDVGSPLRIRYAGVPAHDESSDGRFSNPVSGRAPREFHVSFEIEQGNLGKRPLVDYPAPVEEMFYLPPVCIEGVGTSPVAKKESAGDPKIGDRGRRGIAEYSANALNAKPGGVRQEVVGIEKWPWGRGGRCQGLSPVPCRECPRIRMGPCGLNKQGNKGLYAFAGLRLIQGFSCRQRKEGSSLSREWRASKKMSAWAGAPGSIL